jgi:hypothetical protein
MNGRRLAGGTGAAIAIAVACVLACGPFVEEIPTVAVVAPAALASYAQGDLGVVRPRLARRYLVQAYRVLSGRTPLALSALRPDLGGPSAARTSDTAPAAEWAKLSAGIIGGSVRPPDQTKRVAANLYQSFLNCHDSAFDLAVRTLRAHVASYGENAPRTLEWVRAQRIVFANCDRMDPALPAALPATADPGARADRDYQIATAAFYAMQYDDAARRFRAIAADAESPWRIYGRYLAARASIRSATIADDGAPEQRARRDERLAAAEADLKATMRDASAAAVHPWARQLLDYIALRIRPVEQLHVLGRALATSPTPTGHEVDDYRWLMDQLVGDTLDYVYPDAPRLAELTEGDDLTDWILAMQGTGDTAPADRAVARWEATHTMPWLVALLWRLPGDHPAARVALDAAAAVARTSPAFPTVAVMRVRLLARAGRGDEARRALDELPGAPSPGFDAETLNLVVAERLMVADSLDEFLANTARRAVLNESARDTRLFELQQRPASYDKPVFGDDAAVAMNDWFPLDRLADAAASRALPPALRARVASMALARAIVLQRDAEGLRAAAALRDLAPPRQTDIDRYINAAEGDARHVAGLFLLLRTPGMHAVLDTPDDDFSYRIADPDVEFDRLLHRNLWCDLDKRLESGKRGVGESEVVGLLYSGRRVPPPGFLTAEERAAADRELRAIAALGAMRSYLGTEAVRWAREKRRDVDVAEALALAVRQWHFGCGDDQKWGIARQAFTILHRQYPQTDAAKRTRYWYK